jgi:uncharacterized protein with HEPN domain
MDFDVFDNDDKTSSAVVRKFEIIGEASKNIPEDTRLIYPHIPWKEMSGMRDKLIHSYFGVDYSLVWHTIKRRLPELKSAIENILQDLEQGKDSSIKQDSQNLVTLSVIEDALLFVSSDFPGMFSAVFCKDTGKFLFSSEGGDIDEIDEENLDWENCVELPHKNELDLGTNLVFEFVDKYLPDDYRRVDQIFSKRGAYGRFKELLYSKELLETWFEFEDRRTKRALRQWCEENDIPLSD